MLLKRQTLRGIEDGSITLQFRRWTRPTVKAGGSLVTAIGQLAIESVDEVDPERISDADAYAAGYGGRAKLLTELNRRGHGKVFRIRVSVLGPDPRIALRERIPDDGEVAEILERLQRLDRHGKAGPWTRQLLGAIRAAPGTRAAELAERAGMETSRFKGNVRKLKNLGLTESLAVGYRVSPRGLAVLDRLP